MLPMTHAFAQKPLLAPHKLFSEEEANRAICYVRLIAHDVVVAHCQAKSIRCQIEGARGGRLETLESDYRRLSNRLRELIRELDQAGVELRDFEKGTVEFPVKTEGKVAFLTWTVGMPRVQRPLAEKIEVPVAAQAAVVA